MILLRWGKGVSNKYQNSETYEILKVDAIGAIFFGRDQLS